MDETKPEAEAKSSAVVDPFEANKRLGRGINLGNSLDAPKGQFWGLIIKEEHFAIVKEAGFDTVRIPMRWSDYAQDEPPYTIEDAFFARVDELLAYAKAEGLNVILNVHHYEEIMEDPEGHRERLMMMWEQIANHYKDHDNTLFFELLAEPFGKLDPPTWNALIPDLIKVVRQSNPRRTLVIGPADWNSTKALPKLEIPQDERNVIVAIHYYLPFKFTHQGAHWVGEKSQDWLGTTWTGSPEEMKHLKGDFDRMQAWSQSHERPITIGELGAIKFADMDSRARWVSAVRKEAVAHNMSWAYWEFGTEYYGAYDQEAEQWREPLIKALMPEYQPSGQQ